MLSGVATPIMFAIASIEQFWAQVIIIMFLNNVF